jgi:sialic acid synthase SpsE
MKHFIKLSSRVINKLQIIQIVKKTNKYYIHMSNNSNDGFLVYGCGSISSSENVIEICEKNDNQDYNTITTIFDSK